MSGDGQEQYGKTPRTDLTANVHSSRQSAMLPGGDGVASSAVPNAQAAAQDGGERNSVAELRMMLAQQAEQMAALQTDIAQRAERTNALLEAQNALLREHLEFAQQQNHTAHLVTINQHLAEANRVAQQAASGAPAAQSVWDGSPAEHVFQQMLAALRGIARSMDADGGAQFAFASTHYP